MNERKERFIKQLAHFLADNQAGKSILLQIMGEYGGPPVKGLPNFPEEWAKLRSASPLSGYPTVEEAEKILMDFLG